MDLHHQLRASKAHALTLSYRAVSKWSVRLNAMRDSARPKAKPNCVGCEAANLHQHLPGYEPDALAVKLQTNENGRIPRCCPGLLLLPRQASAAGSLVSDEMWTCAPGSHWVTRFCGPLARLFALRTKDEMVPAAGVAPAPPRSQRGMLTVTICRVFEMEPPVRFALTCACLQDRCLSRSATETWLSVVLPSRLPGRLESLPHTQ